MRLVAVRTGLTPHVLRAWERRYGVVSPARTEGGQRLYSDLDIERLRLLRQLTDRGHAIGRIASLPIAELARLDEDTGGAEEAAASSDADGSGAGEAEQTRARSVGESITAVLRATRRLDAVELQAVLEQAAVTHGVPVFIDEVVAPALMRIGHGWAEGSVSVAQEHMASAVFRRVLDWLFRVYEVRGTAPRLVVATPPTQVHEFGALMVAISAAADGWGVTYLGPDLPVADLLSAVGQTGARAVAVSAVYVPEGVDFLAALREMRAGLPEQVPLLVGGAATPEIAAEAEAAGARVIASLPELRAMLRRLAAGELE
ncbi:MAG TPA: MerR family transcriptional regulator [Gemmatimonadales bacterium]|nr:MerR family transcriptional regulator [Gemmatimonadales bacterium]